MTGEQSSRLDALRAVLALFPSWEAAPSTVDVVAMAGRVADGSVSAAAAAEGHRHALYRDHVREEDS